MIFRLIIFFSLLLPASVFAQGGSTYSFLGIGDRRTGVGAQYDAMAGTAIAVPSPYGINTVNPAMLGFSATTRLQAGYRFNQSYSTSGTASLAQNNGNLDGIVALFAIDTGYGLGVSLGLLPYSRVNYLLSRTIATSVEGQQVYGTSEQQGQGGVSQLQVGTSVRILPSLRMGLQVSGLFGIITYSDKLRLDGVYSEILTNNTLDLRGLLFKGGVYCDVTRSVSVGAILGSGTPASVTTSRSVAGNASGDVFYDSTITTKAESPLPLQTGVGISVKTNSGIVGAEVRTEDFSATTIPNDSRSAYTSSLRGSIAYANFSSENPALPFRERIGWYAGIAAEKLYVTYNGGTLLEYTASGGISFPLGGNAMLDAGIAAGMRQPQDVGSITEYFCRLTVSASIGETWFKPFARD
ncbi:MAG: hypothetical protein D8M52_05370 [Chlorobi bacterium]|mgnify:CR=1 FL=1|nr:hypothetical protein [Chlorobiota bacterium]MBV6464716.1 hypothetical protein [Chlorobiota bacterium]